MKQIFWHKTHITVLTPEIEAKPHTHLMLQIFIKRRDSLTVMVNGNAVCGNYIIVNSNVEHSIDSAEKLDCFILIDATSDAAHQFQEHYIENGEYALLPVENIASLFQSFYKNPSIHLETEFSLALFEQLRISFIRNRGYDERIAEVIERLDQYQFMEETIGEIAKKVFLSPSRLSHLFHDQTGIALKSYIIFRKLQLAYLLLARGKSITDVAMEAGFYSPSHLADVNRRMMGMTISRCIYNSIFLEVNQ